MNAEEMIACGQIAKIAQTANMNILAIGMLGIWNETLIMTNNYNKMYFMFCM